MAEAIAFDIAAGLITKLSSLALSRIGLWWNFKDDLDDLKSIVSAIKAVLLDAEERSVTSNLVKDWLGKLKYGLYDADDLLDDFSTEALRKHLMNGNELTKEVRVLFSSSNQFAYGLKMGRKIKARFASIQRQTNGLNLVQRDHPAVAERRQQTHSFVRKDEIIGREVDKKSLLKLLLDIEFQSEENVIIAPIVGIGGLGKTALAQFVFNHERVKDHFDFRLWVCISDVFDLRTIVANIIKSVTNQAPDQNLEIDQLQKQLRDEIDGKKYLLVLDDIWNEEREKWFNLKKLLMGGARGSNIIVTTRSHNVAKITIKCQPYVLEGLSDDDAWSLFKEIAFEQRSADSTNPTFLEIGKQILERCCGVPLVIRTIASTLSIKETENEWRSFKDTKLASISQKDGEIMPTLKLSYDHLPSHLKHCFAYCRLYPKDHRIKIQSLVQLWIAQDFVKQSNPGQSLEEIGLEYFKDLMERNFFQEVEGDEWGMTCKMHDLMHDLAELVSGRESSILDSNSSIGVLEFHHLNFDTVPCSIHKLKHLRYFDLSWSDLKILPDSICEMQNLQVLKLDNCFRLEELPKKIEKLVSLSHLACAGCRSLSHMPSGIGKLTSLQTLSLFVVDKPGSHDAAAADLSELGGLNNLRGELRIINLGFVKNAKEEFRATNLKEKQHLHSLVLHWGDTSDDEEKSLEDLQPHPNLKELKVTGWRGSTKIPSWLSLLTNLTNIEIRDCHKLKHLPSFSQLPHLQRLWIESLIKLEYMDDNDPNERRGESESFFPSLMYLSLKKCPDMKSWWRERPIDDHNNDDRTVIGTSNRAFPRLSNLHIEDCPLTSMALYPSLDEDLTLINTSSRHLKQTIQMNITSMTPSTSSLPLSKLKCLRLKNVKELDQSTLDECRSENLSSLSIANIPQLASLPLWLQHHVQLKTLEIANCSGLRSLFPVFQLLTSLETLKITNCKELELCADGIQTFQDYTCLRVLYLQNIPTYRNLPKWLQHLTNMRDLHLNDFPNLASLPDEMRCLTTLQTLKLERISEMEMEMRCHKGVGEDWHKIAHIPHIFANGRWMQRLP